MPIHVKEGDDLNQNQLLSEIDVSESVRNEDKSKGKEHVDDDVEEGEFRLI